MASFFPKALVFKEWRQQRLWGLLLFLVMGAPMTFAFFANLMNLWSMQEFQSRQFLFENMRNNLLSILGHTPYYISGSMLTYLFLGVAVFGSTIITYDRSHGGLLYTLSGPFTRRQVLRVKAAMGALFLVVILIAFTLILYLFNVAAHTEIAMYWFLRWFCYELLMQFSVFACAMLGATLVGNVVVAPIAGLGIAGIPGALSIYAKFLVQNNAYGNGVSVSESPFQALSHVLAQCSPLYYINYNGSIDFSLFIPSTVVWIVLGYVVAHRFFHVAAIEQMTNFFTFRVLWKWFFWGVSLLVGLVFTAASTNGYHSATLVFVLKHAVFTVIIWLLLKWFIRLYRKRFMEV